nr:MAG TPA: integrase [Caudoviricetes sp.]
MRVAMYLRKSRQDEELINATVEETLAKHEMQLREFANANNIIVNKVFKEVASAGDIENRPVFNELLLEIEKGLWDAILIVSIDRLTRGNALDLERIKNTFKIMNCKIITPLKIYDPVNDDDEFFLDFNMFISSRELKIIRNRMLKGRRTAIEQGFYTASILPFGYSKTKSETGKGWILVPDEKEAPIVKYIFENYASGKRPADIIHYLNNNGMYTKKGVKWNHAKLKRVLKNNVYIGKLAIDRRKTISKIENGVVIKKLVENPDVKFVDGKHEHLIDQVTWDKVQERIRLNFVDMTPIKSELVNPLAGIVKCPHCGKTMKRNHDKKGYMKPYLICPTLRCPTVSAEFDLVEARILDELKQELKNFNVYLDNYEAEYTIQKENKDNELKLLNDTLVKKQNMYARACEMLEEGIYTKELFLSRTSQINAEIESIKNNISELELKDDNNVEVYKRMIPNLEFCINEYHNLDTQKKNMLLKSLIDEVTYSRTKRSLRNQPKDNFDLVIKLRI